MWEETSENESMANPISQAGTENLNPRSSLGTYVFLRFFACPLRDSNQGPIEVWKMGKDNTTPTWQPFSSSPQVGKRKEAFEDLPTNPKFRHHGDHSRTSHY